jgi:serine O-acetyltransferase
MSAEATIAMPAAAAPTDERTPSAPAGLWACLSADLQKLCRGRRSFAVKAFAALTNRGFHAVLLYRVSHALWCWRVPLLPLLLTRVAQTLFAVDIAYEAELGPGIVIVHGFGLVIGKAVRIAGDCCLYHGVTLGNRGSEWVGSDVTDGHPVLEEHVMIGAGAKILGPVKIGRNCVIGANAVVLQDVPECSVVAGIPARVVSRRPEMDEDLRPIGGHRRDRERKVAVLARSDNHV